MRLRLTIKDIWTSGFWIFRALLAAIWLLEVVCPTPPIVRQPFTRGERAPLPDGTDAYKLKGVR